MKRAATGTITALVAVMLSGCSSDPRECELEEEHCADGVAFDCESYARSRETGTRWNPIVCASPDHCVAMPKAAFCVLEPEPDPRCDGNRDYCDGLTSVECTLGYVVGRTACVSCEPDNGSCAGADGGICYDGRCASGVTCRADGTCATPCDCPEGDACEACSAVTEYAGGERVCRNGWCALQPR